MPNETQVPGAFTPTQEQGKLLFIENEGALFRGPARGVPLEVWNRVERKFVPYVLAGQPKPVDWGSLISEEEARSLMV
jgi:hypothetical protein